MLRREWRSIGLRFQHAPCCSNALREQLLQAGVPLQQAPTIYEGIDVDAYVRAAESRRMPSPNDLLMMAYVGLMVEHKGVHIAVQAMAQLPREILSRVRLTLLGSGHPDYERRLREMVLGKGLQDHIVFADPISRTELPGFLARQHVLIMPSVWEEPLALIMQEGLASGLAVIASATGGTKEVIVSGENGLLFEAGDADRLADHIEHLARTPAQCASLGARAQQTAREKFDLARMVDDIEAYLTAVSAAASRRSTAPTGRAVSSPAWP
jgi:glycosyltransferase involved in cell wall biosynthesis